MWISWRSFMREIMVRGWVAVTSSNHIPYCTPIHWYILLLALWASRGLLWPFLSFSLAYLFWPRLGTYPCALCIYWLDLWALWAWCHSSFVLSCIIASHRLPVSPVSIISIHFASFFPCVMMMRSSPRATSQVCHTLRSAYRLWSRILRLKGSVKIWGLGFFLLDCDSMEFGPKKTKKNEKGK